MKDKFVIFAEEPPIELQLSTEMRCREIEDNPDIDYVKRYCVSLLRNNAKRDAILAATLQELAEAHVIISKIEKVQIIHWWVLRRMIKNFNSIGFNSFNMDSYVLLPKHNSIC